jgi:HK97 family phage major capsid protein
VNPAVNGLINASQPTLKNRPIVPLEQCQAVGTTGDVILADFSQYLVIDKGGMGMQTASSIHVKFVYDEMTYRFTYRVDGQPLWHSTLTAANSGTTRSPFVGLGTRTA